MESIWLLWMYHYDVWCGCIMVDVTIRLWPAQLLGI